MDGALYMIEETSWRWRCTTLSYCRCLRRVLLKNGGVHIHGVQNEDITLPPSVVYVGLVPAWSTAGYCVVCRANKLSGGMRAMPAKHDRLTESPELRHDVLVPCWPDPAQVLALMA
jgi:hypothetical protein